MEDIKQRLPISGGEVLMYLSTCEEPPEQEYPGSVLSALGERGLYFRRRVMQNESQLWQTLHSSESLEIRAARFVELCAAIFPSEQVDAETVFKALCEVRIENSYRQELFERSGLNFDPLTYTPLLAQADALGCSIVLPNFERSVYVGEVVAHDYCYRCWMVKVASGKAIILPFAASPSGLPPMIGTTVKVRFSHYKLDLALSLSVTSKTRELGAG